MTKKTTDCPYCREKDFVAGFERRPGQHVERCTGCGKYSVRNARNGIRYELSDPFDPDSMPQV